MDLEKRIITLKELQVSHYAYFLWWSMILVNGIWNLTCAADRERAGAESLREREEGAGRRPHTTSSHPVVSPAPEAATEEAKAR